MKVEKELNKETEIKKTLKEGKRTKEGRKCRKKNLKINKKEKIKICKKNFTQKMHYEENVSFFQYRNKTRQWRNRLFFNYCSRLFANLYIKYMLSNWNLISRCLVEKPVSYLRFCSGTKHLTCVLRIILIDIIIQRNSAYFKKKF